jgi:hypothetical protein
LDFIFDSSLLSIQSLVQPTRQKKRRKKSSINCLDSRKLTQMLVFSLNIWLFGLILSRFRALWRELNVRNEKCGTKPRKLHKTRRADGFSIKFLFPPHPATLNRPEWRNFRVSD